MTHDQIAELMDRRGQALAEANAEALSEMYAQNAVLESPISGVAEGRAAIRQSYEQLFSAFGPLDVTRKDLIVDGNRVVTYFTAQGTHCGDFFGLPATGIEFTIRAVSVTTFEGMEIVHERRVHDFTGLLVRLGVLKERPGR